MNKQLDNVREFLNPIAYREMQRRKWTDEHIAIRLGISIHTLKQFKRKYGLIKKYKYHR